RGRSNGGTVMNRRGDSSIGRRTVEFDLTNHRDRILADAGAMAPDQVRRVRVSGTVDTGANYLVLPGRVAARVGVPVSGPAAVRHPGRGGAPRRLGGDGRGELRGRPGAVE